MLKLLPRAEVLWKTRLQFFSVFRSCERVCVALGRGKAAHAAFERLLRIGLLGCHDTVSGDYGKGRRWLNKTGSGC